MWVYIRTEPDLWTVGFYDPKGKFQTDSDHSNTEEAARRVRYLNGGSPDEGTKMKNEDALSFSAGEKDIDLSFVEGKIYAIKAARISFSEYASRLKHRETLLSIEDILLHLNIMEDEAKNDRKILNGHN